MASYNKGKVNSCPTNLLPLPFRLKYKLLPAKINVNCCPCQSVQKSIAEGDSPTLKITMAWNSGKECLSVQRNENSCPCQSVLLTLTTCTYLMSKRYKGRKYRIAPNSEHGAWGTAALANQNPLLPERLSNQKVTRLLPLLISPVTLQ